MRKAYRGGCHWGAVRFEADFDLGRGTGKCNCSICWKIRLWTVKVRPEAFRILAGEADMVDYKFGSGVAHHLFCRHCGVRPFERVDMPNMTGGPYCNINIACLDAVDIDELMAAPVTFYDGHNDDWGATPAEVRHL